MPVVHSLPFYENIKDKSDHQVKLHNNKNKDAAVEWCNKNINYFDTFDSKAMWSYTVSMDVETTHSNSIEKSVHIVPVVVITLHSNSLEFLMHLRLMDF